MRRTRLEPQGRRFDPVPAHHLPADDLHAVIGSAMTGTCLPKTHTPEQVRRVGELLAAAEQQAGLAEGSIKVVPLLESAAGILSAPAIAREPRVGQLGLASWTCAQKLASSRPLMNPSCSRSASKWCWRRRRQGSSRRLGRSRPTFAIWWRCGSRRRRFAGSVSAADGQSIPPRCQ
jgi:hypothetical protein